METCGREREPFCVDQTRARLTAVPEAPRAS
jgi:hypothetical protein